eukprot:CAMPEP_0174738236 /NCGR_PEP_ID=MMETSP1094-20130205/69602_1 /TAXON_ID=156173 /ORGANISM="Chrysochromulina brevifilum, Strain UTEX LB 985" /LENGTH=49 /DNA_ID=CAMNT_0015941601 /DNA_START=480 /DNA_END=629 /DNA_ORIENTATION=-
MAHSLGLTIDATTFHCRKNIEPSGSVRLEEWRKDCVPLHPVAAKEARER